MKMGPTGCPETSSRNYHYEVRNNLEERSSRLLRGGSLKSRDLNLHLRFMSCLHADPFYSGRREVRDVVWFWAVPQFGLSIRIPVEIRPYRHSSVLFYK
jgi:hypothetical protein